MRLLAAFLDGLTAGAEETPRREVRRDDSDVDVEARKAGSDVREASHATRRAVKHASRAVAKGTRKSVHKVAHRAARAA